MAHLSDRRLEVRKFPLVLGILGVFERLVFFHEILFYAAPSVIRGRLFEVSGRTDEKCIQCTLSIG